MAAENGLSRDESVDGDQVTQDEADDRDTLVRGEQQAKGQHGGTDHGHLDEAVAKGGTSIKFLRNAARLRISSTANKTTGRSASSSVGL